MLLEFDAAAVKLGRFAPALLSVPHEIKQQTTDIIIKIGSPILLCCFDRIWFLSRDGHVSAHLSHSPERTVTKSDIDALFMELCGYAVYSHIDELRHGYISVGKKFRIGVSAAAVIENGILRTVRDITSLTVRIPREVRGSAEVLFDAGVQPERGILIAGAPSSGKTTLLRDLARIIGNSRRTTVLDERFELSADGYELGVCTTVLQGYPKAEGFSHALRCLSPQFIICDEIGDRDLPAIHSAIYSGVSIIATVHAGSEQELRKRALCRSLTESGAFGYAVLLEGRTSPTKIRKIMEIGDLLETHGFTDRYSVRYSNRYYGNDSIEDARRGNEYFL